MVKNIRPWNELSRAEKIKHIFDYPESMRDSQAKDLWGPETSGYYEHIHFPPTAPWKEIVEVLKSCHNCQCTAYVRLTDKNFKCFGEEDLKKLREKEKDLPFKYRLWQDSEYCAYLKWREKMLRGSKPKLLNLEFYDDNSIVSRVCTEEGDRGDEDGFGVEPDMWASALFDFKGNVIQPFAPGYILNHGDRY